MPKQRTATLVSSQSAPAQDRLGGISVSCALQVNLQGVASTGRCRSTGRCAPTISLGSVAGTFNIYEPCICSATTNFGAAQLVGSCPYPAFRSELTTEVDMALGCLYQRPPRRQGRGKHSEQIQQMPRVLVECGAMTLLCAMLSATQRVPNEAAELRQLCCRQVTYEDSLVKGHAASSACGHSAVQCLFARV